MIGPIGASESHKVKRKKRNKLDKYPSELS